MKPETRHRSSRVAAGLRPARAGRYTRFRLLLLIAASLCCLDAAPPPTEYEVKAAFIYNFAKYVQWPPPPHSDSNAPFVIGVLGKDPFGKVLDEAMKGQTVQGRLIIVRRFVRTDEIDCDILFVCSSERQSLQKILEALRRRPVLTIGEMDQFAELGGMINLTREQNRVHFDMNPQAIRRAGLKAGSQLFRLARIVNEASR